MGDNPGKAANPSPAAPAGDGLPARGPVPVVDSAQLLLGGNEIRIDHKGEIYRLQLTKSGKLILTK